MRALSFSGIVALTTALSVGVANADICSDLAYAKRENNSRKTQLLRDYPGTVATLFACAGAAAQQPKDDQAGAFLVYCGSACLIIGFDNCANLGGVVLDIMSRDEDIRRQAQANYCSIPN